jgi:hypothetical protein
MNVNERVKAAFHSTQLGNLLSIMLQRTPGPDQKGSVFLEGFGLMDLLKADWSQMEHPNVQAPAVAFICDIPGRVRVKSLSWVLDFYGPNANLTLMDGHKTKMSPEGSGFVECVFPLDDLHIMGVDVQHTTVLLGPGETYKKCDNVSYHDAGSIRNCPNNCEGGYIASPREVVWTFFPGDPIGPSKVKDNGLHGKSITAAVAKEMGFTYVKLA